MELKKYFSNVKGLGVLSTADTAGKVNSAIYSRPHIMDDGSVAFIMRDKLTHHNSLSNPYAVYLFREDAPGYKGKRLYLKKIREENDPGLIASLGRRTYPPGQEPTESRFLVLYELENELPLIGDGDQAV
jgi:hypothetical protein